MESIAFGTSDWDCRHEQRGPLNDSRIHPSGASPISVVQRLCHVPTFHLSSTFTPPNSSFHLLRTVRLLWFHMKPNSRCRTEFSISV